MKTQPRPRPSSDAIADEFTAERESHRESSRMGDGRVAASPARPSSNVKASSNGGECPERGEGLDSPERTGSKGLIAVLAGIQEVLDSRGF